MCTDFSDFFQLALTRYIISYVLNLKNKTKHLPLFFLQCSLTCGSGVRRRNVTCSRNTGAECDPQKKPLTVTTCSVQDCPQVVDNFGGIDWSGSGWSSKEVLNEINSIPVAKPPPKYSTTRAQPVNHNDLNKVVGGDFHYHNNIENIDNSLENNVEVDDFYYDYNFINFHEDLSDENDGQDSRETKPTDSENENVYMETTRAPTVNSTVSTVSETTAHTLKTSETQKTKLDDVKDNENPPTKESMQTNSENLDDFLSEDNLLPVSTTRSPPLSTTKHLQKKKHNDLQWPENISTMPSLASTTKEPAQDLKWGQDGEEAENNYDDFTEEENHTEDFTVAPKHAAPTPGLQPTNSSIAPTTVTEDDFEYSYYEESTQEPNVSASQDVEIPEPAKTTVQLDERASEIPQTNSESPIIPTTDFDQTHLSTINGGNSWVSDHDLSVTSLPVSEKSSPLPNPHLLISGNQEASDDTTSLTGTGFLTPTNLEGITQSSPTDFQPATTEQTLTKRAVTGRTGIDSTSQSPLLIPSDFDYNEIVLPPVVRTSSKSDTSTSYQLFTSTAATPQPSTTPAHHIESPTPAPLPKAGQAPPFTQVTTVAYWVTGNWSLVSPHGSTHSVFVLILWERNKAQLCLTINVCFYNADTVFF